MKTDTLFYSIFQEYPSIFFELISRQDIDASTYEFKAVEQKQTAFRLDGLLLPVPKNPQQPIYFLEVQFQKKQNVYSNLFAKVFTYLDKNDPTQNWRAVVVYKSRSLEPTELAPYQVLLSSNQVVRVYLDAIHPQRERSLGIGIVKLVVERESRAAERGKQLISQARQELTDDRDVEKVIDLIKTILLYKFANLSREELQQMLGLEEFKQTRLGQELLAEGRQEGREEGRQEGRVQGKLKAVPVLLASGFTVEQVANLLELEVEQVRGVISNQEQNQN